MELSDNKPVLVTSPYLPPLDDFMVYLEQIWESKWLTNNGRFHQELEQALCAYLGVKYLSLFSNGTLALITAIQTLKLSGEVITTPFSFVATTHALWWNNIKPVFVDIEPNTFNLNPAKIESAITPRTTGILPVHVYGYPCDVEGIQEVADLHGLKVIYDACHTFGVTLRGVPVLNFGDLSVMSFHATKVFTTFEGGAIICHDEATKRRIDHLKNFGFEDGKVISHGINAKMNEVQAAMGLLQLKTIHLAIQERKEISDHYRSALSDVKGIRFLDDMKDVTHCYSYFPVLVDASVTGYSRDQLFEALEKENIICRKYFYPLISQFPIYSSLESADSQHLPVATDVANSVLCLPLFPGLSPKIISKICMIAEGMMPFG